MNQHDSTSEPGRRVAEQPRLTVVSGPSGVGKSSVLAEVLRRRPETFLSVSVTTRAPRPGEVDGESYFFVDPAEFSSMVDAGRLLEHAAYAGNCYGTPRPPVEEALAAGRLAVLEIELQGARQVRERMPRARQVMLMPPSWSELAGRLSGRGTEDPAVVRRRLQVAREELDAAGEFDHCIVNSDVSAAAEQLLDLMVGSHPSPSGEIPT